ncbi:MULTISPECIES: hypothetical protein [unclassified Endozoicomonas]|uniref:hypothetical protein n=1 Tax=unclassified Endozoicomonas TaxID=2644528 RepID=UPI0021497DC2|nr:MULTISPECIES: hypothetical protein [unclassified Endozoicomonas]
MIHKFKNGSPENKMKQFDCVQWMDASAFLLSDIISSRNVPLLGSPLALRAIEIPLINLFRVRLYLLT